MRWQTYERYLRSQLAQTLGVPIVGQVFFCADAGSSSNRYDEWLRRDMDVPADLIETGGGAAVQRSMDKMVKEKNDVLLLFPGNFSKTDSIPFNWNKTRTHLIGIGPGPIRHYSSKRKANLAAYGASCTRTFQNTAGLCSFHGVSFNMYTEAATGIAAVSEAGGGNWFKNCYFEGLTRNDTVGIAGATCLLLDHDTASAPGNWDVFDDCTFGNQGQPARTAANGLINVAGTGASGSGNLEFNRCKFKMRAGDVDPCAILIGAGNNSVHGLWEMNDCTFYNLVVDHTGAEPAYVIRDNCGTTHDIVLNRCYQQGFGAWTNRAAHCFVNNGPTNVAAGGVVVAAV